MEATVEQVKNTAKNAFDNTVQEGKKLVNEGKDAVQNASVGVGKHEAGEGYLTKQIEGVTSKVPSVTFLGVALGAIGASALLQLAGRKEDSQFVGQWVPTLLLLGVYNKLVKLQGSE